MKKIELTELKNTLKNFLYGVDGSEPFCTNYDDGVESKSIDFISQIEYKGEYYDIEGNITKERIDYEPVTHFNPSNEVWECEANIKVYSPDEDQRLLFELEINFNQ